MNLLYNPRGPLICASALQVAASDDPNRRFLPSGFRRPSGGTVPARLNIRTAPSPAAHLRIRVQRFDERRVLRAAAHWRAIPIADAPHNLRGFPPGR
jgi:hypothetical protein